MSTNKEENLLSQEKKNGQSEEQKFNGQIGSIKAKRCHRMLLRLLESVIA